jgi:hypothetical protein
MCSCRSCRNCNSCSSWNSHKSNSCCDKPVDIQFFDVPDNMTIANGETDNTETVLFSQEICLPVCKKNKIAIDSNITAEIIEGSTGSNPNAYNVYTLYIDGVRKDQSGYEGAKTNGAPNLSSCSLVWGGCIEGKSKILVEVKAILYGPSGSTSNLNNTAGNFGINPQINSNNRKPAKGANLRIMRFSE